MFNTQSAPTNHPAQTGHTQVIDMATGHVTASVEQRAPALPYQAEQYQAITARIDAAFTGATKAQDASSELGAIKDLRQLLKDFEAEIVVREAAIAKQAKDADTIAAMMAAIASGETDPEKIAAIAKTARPANKVSRSEYPHAPKVHEYLAVPDHNDFKHGFKGSLRSLTEDTHPWAKKNQDGSANMNYFRKATDAEVAEMQRRRDDYIIKKEAARKTREEQQAKKP